MRFVAILVPLWIYFFPALAQEKVAECTQENLDPYSFDGFVDKEGNPVIHYIKRTSIAPRVYQSYFVYPRGPKANRIELPYAVTVHAVGYTKDHFTICVMKRNETREVKQSNVTLLVTDKAGTALLRNVDIDLRSEKDPFFFNDKGIIYSISYAKQKSAIRIRRIINLDIEEFDYPVKHGEEDALSGQLAFCSEEKEADYFSPEVQTKVFFIDGKLFVPDLPRSRREGGLFLYEFHLTAPGTFQTHRIEYSVGERSRFHPFRDKLYFYESKEGSVGINVIDISTKRVVKAFSTDNEADRLMESNCINASGMGRVFERINEPCLKDMKLYILSSNKPWFQVWQTNGQALRLTYGGYWGANQNLWKISYGFNYLSTYISLDTFELISEPGLSRGAVLRNYAYVERKGKEGEYQLLYENQATYLIGFDNKTSKFTIWK